MSNTRSFTLIVAAIAVWLPILAIAGAVPALGAGWPHGALMALGLALTSALAWLYWRGLDEAAREAQKTSWFWGGGLGAVVGIGALALAPPLQGWVADVASPRAAGPLVAGAVFVLVAQALGCAAFWALWWLAKR
jgi:hypothetical protein